MPRADSASPKSAEAKLRVAVFFGVLLLYLCRRSLYFNFDGIACAIAVETSDFKHLVHGNHLAYGVVAWIFDAGWRILGYGGRAMLPLQTLDALLGAGGAAAFASLLRRRGASIRDAALGATALAVSHAWWFWSLEAQVYMLGALFAVLAAREALADEARPIVVGGWQGLAILGHVGHLTATPALLLALPPRHRLRAATTTMGLVGVAYVAAAVFAVRPSSFAEWRLWLLGSAALGPGGAFGWHSAPPVTALYGWLRNTLRVFCEFEGLPVFAAFIAVLTAAAVVGAAVAGALRAGRERGFWLRWLAGYALLFLLWEPLMIVYRISDLIGLWSLAVRGLSRWSASRRAAAFAIWIIIAGGLNFTYVVSPHSLAANNPDLTEASILAARTPTNAWIVATERGEVYDAYFGMRRPLALRYVPSEAALFARLDAIAAGGEEAYVTRRTLIESRRAESLQRYGLQFVGADIGNEFYRVKRAASRSAAE